MVIGSKCLLKCLLRSDLLKKEFVKNLGKNREGKFLKLELI